MNDFSSEKVSKISSLKPGARIHFLGVAGIAMAQLAVHLSKKGFLVSGSDNDFWEPSGSLLKASNVKTFKGYDELPECDLVVIGNAIRADNALLPKVKKYTTFAQALYEVVIEGKKSLVVSGTHGKTTTTALTAWCLEQGGHAPSYFIGGSVLGLDSSLHVGSGNFSVVEGDEYDTAFFAKVPKFDFYKPDILLVTSVEFDHADIYQDIGAINKEFSDLVEKTTEKVIVAEVGENLKQLIPEWRNKSKVISYGLKCGDVPFLRDKGKIKFTFEGEQVDLCLSIPGEHNAYNAVGSWLLQRLGGVKSPTGFETFRGVKRRQEVKFDSDKVTLIEDFAHHPTAVKETLKALREKYPDRQIVACFEPRSNTSRRKIFENDYANALRLADLVFIKEVVQRHNDTSDNLLSSSDLVTSLGKGSACFRDVKDMADRVFEHLSSRSLIIIMSNGSFDGLVEMLLKRLA